MQKVSELTNKIIYTKWQHLGEGELDSNLL